jgi:hypothetical protein
MVGQSLMRRRAIIFSIASALLGAFAIGVLIRGAGQSVASPQGEFAPKQYAHALAPEKLKPSASARSGDDIVDEVLNGNRFPAIAAGHIGGPPSDVEADPDSQVLYLTLRAPGTPRNIRSIWEAYLATGLINDKLRISGQGRLSGTNFVLELPDGARKEISSGIGNAVAGQLFAESRASIIDTITSGAEKLGLKVDSVDFLQPAQLAPIVIVETVNPSETLKTLELEDSWRTLLGDYRNYEGWYLEIRDNDGQLVSISAGAGRAAVGQSWTRLDLDTSNTRPTEHQ